MELFRALSEKGVKFGVGGDCPDVAVAEHQTISMASRGRIILRRNQPDGGASGMAYSYWASGELETNSFSTWETLLEDEPQLTSQCDTQSQRRATMRR
ncbi:unnamed protein product [Strongylus vulgaris]|uniref:Uncharacterized protein n=1 Tax=Strongylus vulgaris TaxID=40348 RepID=A0A3P7JMK8_STRVU|nr:unnamed protein product [Strongylus vulgaris]